MKAYTDLEQSRKLAEFLPLESADMEYMFLKRDGSKVSNVPFVKDEFENPECGYIFIPCWSLAALLNVLPDAINNNSNEFSLLEFTKKSCLYTWNYYGIKIGVHKDNLIDACYEMILKLKEKEFIMDSMKENDNLPAGVILCAFMLFLVYFIICIAYV